MTLCILSPSLVRGARLVFPRYLMRAPFTHINVGWRQINRRCCSQPVLASIGVMRSTVDAGPSRPRPPRRSVRFLTEPVRS